MKLELHHAKPHGQILLLLILGTRGWAANTFCSCTVSNMIVFQGKYCSLILNFIFKFVIYDCAQSSMLFLVLIINL